MNESLLGATVPIWILGAPLLLAFVDLMRTPTPSPTRRHTPAMPASVVYPAGTRQPSTL